MADIDFNFLFRGISELDGVVNDLAKIELLNEQLKNQELEYRKASREAAAARKQAAEESRAATVAQINAELGIKKELENEIGIIEQLRQRIKLLKSEREKANDVASINTYTKAITASTTELNKLLGVTDKFRGSNGFWREITQYASAFFAATQVADWTGKIFTAQSAVEGFQLSLKRLVGENQAKLIEEQLKVLIVDTPLGFDNATKGIERLIFAYQNAGVSTKNIVKDFEAFGNVAKGNDENLKGIVKALDDVANTGKLTGQEILQFGNAGVNIIGLLAESTGKTRKEIKAMQADGTLSFDLVREAIIKAGSEGGKFAGAMSVAMSTVSGKFAQYKDAVFFALANVGNYFADSAKKTLVWGTSIIQSLFGTQKATEATLDILKTLTITIGSYIVTTKAAGVASAAWALVEKGWLIIRGELILLTRQQAIANATLSESQWAAAASAQVFNNTLMKNPIGLIALAIGTAITAYQLYNATQEKTIEEQNKLNKSIIDAVAPLELQKREFNSLANEVLKGVVPLQKQYETLEELKKQYPKLLEGVTNLTDAERILNENKIKVNTQDSYRLERLEELKKKYPDQLIGINNLKDAELKLSGVLKEVNADFAVRALLLEADIKYNLNKEKATNLIKDQITAEENLGKLKIKLARERQVMSLEENSEQQLASLIRIKGYEEQQKQYEGTIRAQKEGVINLIGANQSIAKIQEEARKRLKYNYDEEVSITKNAEDKKTKEKIDSAKTLALIEEKSNNDSLERTRRTEQESLRIEKEINVQRVNDSELSAKAKKAKILAIEAKYRSDSSQLTDKWDKKEEEDEIKNGTLIAKIRANFRALNEKDEKKSLDAQIKAIEAKYKNEIDIVNKSSKSYNEKKAEITKLVIEEEKELLVIRRQIEFLKDLDKLHKEQAKNIQKITKEILEKWKIQDKIDKEEVEHQKELAKLYQERQEIFSKAAASIIPEAKEFINYNQAVNNAGRAIVAFADEKLKLVNIEGKFGRLSDEYVKQLEITNKAQEASVKASTEVTESRIAVIKSATEVVLSSIIKLIANSASQLSNAVNKANQIYQDFAKQQRQAEIASFKSDLSYRLEQLDGNYDKQIDLLKDYLNKASELVERINIADSIATEFQIASDKITRIAENLNTRVENFSLNPIKILTNTISSINQAIGSFYDNNLEVQQRAAITIGNTISNLQWQRDETLSILDDMADAYREKYDQMLDTVKQGYSDQVDEIRDGMNKSIDEVRDGLSSQLDALSTWYDGLRDVITQKYADILDNNVRYTDKAFEEQLAIWNSARTEQEKLLIEQRDREKGILKAKYLAGEITLQQYLDGNKKIEEQYFSDVIALRTVFYDDLQKKTDEYTAAEFAQLERDYAAGLITEDDYLKKKGDLEDIARQRSGDIKSLVKQDRDKDLTSLKNDYLDIKVLLEDKAAKEIEKIQGDSKKALKEAEQNFNDEIIRLTTLRNNQLAALAKQRVDTELAYNAQIFEQQRALAKAQALIAFEQAKAQAYSNPFTAAETMKGILIEFNKILEAIDKAPNPFQRQIEDRSIEENKNKPADIPNNPNAGDGSQGSFAKGTERLPRKSGQQGVDTELIYADAGERIWPTDMNNQLKAYFGKDLTNKQLFNYIVNPNYDYIANIGREKTKGEPIVAAINGLGKQMKNLKQVNVTVKNGIPSVEERISSRMTKFYKP